MKKEIIAINQAKYITVLDFEVGIVFQYNIKEWDLENESCEDFISNKGHRLNNCEWMVHEFQGFHVTNVMAK